MRQVGNFFVLIAIYAVGAIASSVFSAATGTLLTRGQQLLGLGALGVIALVVWFIRERMYSAKMAKKRAAAIEEGLSEMRARESADPTSRP